MDKKIILKEIEVLIRSIKVHYDNIENESRIPTIELELITSKIRKLHEKSIIYNYIHYLEEEQMQQSKRLRYDNIIESANLNSNKTEASTLNEKDNIFSLDNELTEPIISNINDNSKVKKINLLNNFSINDRFRFTKELFGGIAEDFELVIDHFGKAYNKSNAIIFLNTYKQKYDWDEKNETVIDFYSILYSIF